MHAFEYLKNTVSFYVETERARMWGGGKGWNSSFQE